MNIKQIADVLALLVLGMPVVLSALVENSAGERDFLPFAILGLLGLLWIIGRFVNCYEKVEVTE